MVNALWPERLHVLAKDCGNPFVGIKQDGGLGWFLEHPAVLFPRLYADTPAGYIVVVHPDRSEELMESAEAVRRSLQKVAEFFDQKERAKQKAASRDDDARDVAKGRATIEEMQAGNSFIPGDVAREAIITDWGDWGQDDGA